MMRRMMACAAVIVSIAAPAGAEPVTTIQFNGDSANRFDIAVLGDGYAAAELGKFASDVRTFLGLMFAQQPWAEYASLMNVHRVDVTSAESGASHPENSVTKNTALGAAYNCGGIQRLVCINNAAVNAVVARSLGAAQHDLVLVIVNDSVYGGSGGAVAVASTHTSAVELILHEVGHSLGLLTDEYTDNPPACPSTTNEPPYANATLQTSRTLIKWGAWVAATTPLPTTATTAAVPGAYVGANYCASGVFRPTFNSKMRSLAMPYEQINSEQLVKRFYNFVRPIDSFSPAGASVTIPAGGSTTFQVSTPTLATHAIGVTWLLDGVAVATGNSLAAAAASIPSGTHTLQAVVRDATDFVRTDPSNALQATQAWTVTGGSGTGGFTPGVPGAVTASSNGSTVTLTWSAPSSGSAPTDYIIEAGSAAGLADLANFSTQSTATTFTATGVGAGRYFVRVRASNLAGRSLPTADAILTVGATCAATLAAPQLSFQVSGTTVSLAWTPSPGATSYVLEAGSSPGSSNLVNSDTGTSGTTFVATGVGSGTYYVRVRAKNVCSVSGASSESTVVVR